MGRKKQTGLEPQDQRNNSGKFPGFSFWPHFPDFKLNRLAIQKHKQVQTKQNPNKSPLSLAQRGKPTKTEHVHTVTSLFQTNTTEKNCDPMHTSTNSEGI